MKKILNRPRASSERLDILATLESQTNLEWIMRSSQMTQMRSNIKMIPKEQLNLGLIVPDYEGVATIWAETWFGLKKISQFRGLLIYDNQFCLILSDCFVEKKRYQQSYNRAYFLQLANYSGQLILIFSHPSSLKQWSKCLKKYCRKSDFYKKYKILEQTYQNYYCVQQKKQKLLQTAQIINMQSIQNENQFEIFDNYLKILRNSTIPGYLQLFRVYEENKLIFIISNHIKGDSLANYMNKKQCFQQQEIAQIAHQILLTLKILQEEELYHGNINFDNIFCCPQSKKNLFDVYLLNTNYKLYQPNTLQHYVKSIPNYLVAPEILNGSNPNVQSDLYALGVILYLISFYKPNYKFTQEYFQYQVSEMYNLINTTEKLLQNQKKTEYTLLFSLSQLELIKKLVKEDPLERISAQVGLKHVWFVNNKEKKHNKVIPRIGKLPSLRTIIEIREQSECEIRRTLLFLQDDQDRISKQYDDPSGRQYSPQRGDKISKGDLSDYNSGTIKLFQFKQNTGQGSDSQLEFFEEENVIYNLIEKLNQQNYQLVPSRIDHGNMVRSEFGKH